MRPILLDTDIGSNVDDMLALAFLLRSPTLHLEGITTVYGNTELRARIAGVVCRLAGRPDVPIVPGIATPLSGRQVFWAGSEGEDIPGLDDANSVSEVPIESFIVDLAARHAGQLEILAIGPLTNLAAGLRRYPALPSLVKRLYLMGGCFYEGRPEHNIRCDVTAAEAVFGSGFQITALGLDVTTLPWITPSELSLLEKLTHPLPKLLAAELRSWWRFRNAEKSNPHDALAALSMERPDLFRFENSAVAIETGGPLRGCTRLVPGPAKQIAKDVFSRLALEEIMRRLFAYE